MTAPKILIVDDEPYIRELLKATLEDEVYVLLEANTGARALDIASSQQPDLVILDVAMPGELDGIEVCRRLKASQTTQGIKVVLLTARGEEDRLRGLQAGADEYVTKPFSPLALLSKLDEMLGRANS